MALVIRQSTSVVISFGSFVDKGDGVTPEVGLVSAIDHATTGILLSKNGGALTIRSQAVTASTYDAYAMYLVTLSATDTNTVGTLRMAFIETATCLPVWQDLQVVEENVYDAWLAASAAAGTDLASILTDTGTTLDGKLPVALVGGRMDSDIGAKTGNVALSAQEKLDVNTQADTALTDYDPPTNAEMVARTLAAASYALEATLTTITALVDDLESRLSAVRAGYLDNLSAGAVALEATLTAMKGAGWATETLKAIKDAIPAAAPSVDAIADQVWDEVASGHVTAGTMAVISQNQHTKL